MSIANVPQDICQWLDSLGLQKRLVALNKNFILGFVDGLLVADVVGARFPRLVQLHNYSDTSSASGRMSNWEILNRKVLSAINCELGEEDITRISNRQIQKVAIVTFLRLLRAKMESYAPAYHAEQQAIATEQKMRGQKLSMNAVSISAANKLQAQDKVAQSASSSSSSKAKQEEQQIRRPSLTKSMQLLTVDKGKEKLRKQARGMTEEDMDNLYAKVSESVRNVVDTNSAKVDKMAQRSKEINDHMNALRAQNLDDMKKVNRRLGTLLNQLQVIETNADAAMFMDASVNADDANLDENTGSKSFIGLSRRSSAIGMKILDMLPAGVQAKPNQEMEKSIQRRSSTILMNRVGIKMTPATSAAPSSVTFTDDEQQLTSTKVKVTKGAGEADVFAFGKDGTDVEMKATHRRVYDSGADRHFYVNADTGESTWTPPKDGIINCIDENTGKTFFTNAKTRKTAWSIEEVV